MGESVARRRPEDEAEAEAGREAILAEAGKSEVDQPAVEREPPSDDDYVPV
jgi:hypothetical protein